MKLPAAADYLDALQDSSTCFADPELAGAEPVLGPLGLPRAISGNVATVFRLDGADGRSWAVRCFVRPLDDSRGRYEAVAAHLAGLSSPWRVPFELQPCGVRVDGEWWPIVKMAWAPGTSLIPWVERHLWDPSALAYQAVRFAALAEQLRADGVAHGDLQHGNILVAPGGDLRLVDYDGMWVPALAGHPGTERGHRSYQHPGRQPEDFGPDLDHFSSWVVYASLAALAADPLLWSRLDGGEEALLLREHDLADPEHSAAFAALAASDGRGVPGLGALLRSFLARDPAAVPPLSPAVAPVPQPATSAADGGGAGDLEQRRALSEALGGLTPAWPGATAAVGGGLGLGGRGSGSAAGPGAGGRVSIGAAVGVGGSRAGARPSGGAAPGAGGGIGPVGGPAGLGGGVASGAGARAPGSGGGVGSPAGGGPGALRGAAGSGGGWGGLATSGVADHPAGGGRAPGPAGEDAASAGVLTRLPDGVVAAVAPGSGGGSGGSAQDVASRRAGGGSTSWVDRPAAGVVGGGAGTGPAPGAGDGGRADGRDVSAGAGGEAPAGDGAWAGAAPGRRRTGLAPGAAGEPFGGQVHAGRVALVAAAAAAALLLLVGLVTTLVVAVLGPVGATVAAGLHLRRLYQSTPEARAAERADVAWSAPRRAVVDAEQAVEQLARERAALAADEAAAEGTAETARAARRRRDEEELAAVDAALETELAAVAERERLVNRAEQEARAAALAELQLKVIDDQLRHHSVVASGALDDKLVHRLAFDDVRTAADFTAVEATKAGTVVVRRDGRRLTVSGLEPLRATALVTWRRRMAQAAQLKVPARLPRADAAAIRAEHDRRRGALTAEADAAREAARTRAAAVRARAEREDAELATTVAAAAVDAAQRRVALDRRLVTARKAAAEARWHLDEHERRHGPTVVPADLATYVRRVLGLDGSARPGP